MAALSTTINESISVFGLAPTNKWGEMVWGDNWGTGNTDLETNVFQEFDTPAANEISISDEVIVVFIKTINETLSVNEELNDINLKDDEGYSYTFTLPTDDAEDRAGTSWSESSDPSTSYSEESEPSTTWTDA